MKARGPSRTVTNPTVALVVQSDECIFELETAQSRSYGELLELKALLLAEPVWSGVELVRLTCEQRFYFLAALLASAELGLSVELAPRHQPQAGSSPASLCICDQPRKTQDFEGRMRETSSQKGRTEAELAVAPLDAKLSQRGADRPSSLTEAIDLSRLRVDFWTSGSSDEPRSFAKNSGQLLSEGWMLREFWDIQENERLLCTTPPHHIYGFLWGVILPLLSGASVVSAMPRHGQSILEAVVRAKPNRLISVPAQLAAFLSASELRESNALLPALRIVSSGAPLDRDIARGLEAHGATVLEVLGSTETGGIAWRRTSASDIFQPLPHVQVTRSDAGALLVDSAHLPDGARPFVTSDLVEMREGGFVHLGRADSIAKIGANRVSLRDMEERALRLPGVFALRALALPAKESLTHSLELCAVVVAPGYSISLLRAALLSILPPELWPKRIRRVDSFPVDDRGKVKAAALAALFDEPSPEQVPLTVIEDAHPVQRTEGRASFTVSVPGNASCLEGHFPSAPIVPGAVLLQEAVLGPVLRRWQDLVAPVTFENVRFEHPLRPFDQASVRLERSDQRIDFRVTTKTEVVARGSCVLQRLDP